MNSFLYSIFLGNILFLISLSTISLSVSLTGKGLVGNGVSSVNSSSISIFGQRPISSLNENAFQLHCIILFIISLKITSTLKINTVDHRNPN